MELLSPWCGEKAVLRGGGRKSRQLYMEVGKSRQPYCHCSSLVKGELEVGGVGSDEQGGSCLASSWCSEQPASTHLPC